MKNVDKMKFFYNEIFFKKLEEGGLNSNDYAIAGGAIRDYLTNGEIKDIDIFTQHKEAEDALINFFKTNNVKIMNENDSLLNVSWQNRWFQVIKGKHYNLNTPELIDSFDFTICCAMLTKENYFTNLTFYQDALAKHLRINKITFPLSTLERMQKYIKKGYEACNGTILAIAKSCATVNFEDPQQDTLRFYPDGTPRFLGID